MKTQANPQMGLLDSFMTRAPAIDFLDCLHKLVDWALLAAAVQAMYPAPTGRPPHAPPVVFKMNLLQHCCGLSDPRREVLVTAATFRLRDAMATLHRN